MVNTYQKPMYNLGAVVQETGVEPDTLRAWERRYGLPDPARTKGGHRLYSRRDVDTIKWLLARQEEGMRISRAVELWRSLDEAGQDPLQPTHREPRAETIAEHTIAELRQAWISACLAFDEREAEQILTQALALYPPETVGLELLLKGVAQIGQGWYEGEVTVQQEHFASELVVRRIEALLQAAPPPTRAGRILAACPPEEEHALGLLWLTYLLRRRGWEVLYLGANVPIVRLEEVTRTAGPSLVISVALQLPTAATLLEMARFLQQEGIPLAFGGRIFDRLPALRARIPGHFVGSGLEQAHRSVEELMTAPRPTPLPEPIAETCRQALGHYREHRLRIEADLAQRPDLLREPWFTTINRRLARDIIAALTLGDIDLVDDSIDWLTELNSDGHVPVETLDDYLDAYYQAAQKHLDERGAPIVNWLSRRVERRG
jgi:DNA-binding transcriptional MerR regulator